MTNITHNSIAIGDYVGVCGYLDGPENHPLGVVVHIENPPPIKDLNALAQGIQRYRRRAARIIHVRTPEHGVEKMKENTLEVINK